MGIGHLESIIRYAMKEEPKIFIPGQTKVPLSIPTYGAEEVNEALDSLMSTWVTMGKKVKKFEEMFAEYIGVKHAIMVNSGSSANLLALSVLREMGVLSPGDEIITPAVTWATTVFPIANVGCVPVLVDVGMDYNIDPGAVEKAITAETRVIMPVHLLGNPCDMGALAKIAVENGLIVVEDACESHGAEYKGWRTGSMGVVSTFSFFFSHHISTIEGGMICTNNPKIDQICRSMRSHGWIRDLEDKDKIAAAYPDIDPRFLFVNSGYNFRPTEIQGAFGIHQLPRLDRFVDIRRENAAYWTEHLNQFSEYLTLPCEAPNTKHSWFSFPITVKPDAPFSKQDLVNYLESQGLETRPIEAGNMAVQPAMKNILHRKTCLPNSEIIQKHAFFFGNHHGIGQPEREAVVKYFTDFINEVA